MRDQDFLVKTIHSLITGPIAHHTITSDPERAQTFNAIITEQELMIEGSLKTEKIPGEFEIIHEGTTALGHIATGIISHEALFAQNRCDSNFLTYDWYCAFFKLLVNNGATPDIFFSQTQTVRVALCQHFEAHRDNPQSVEMLALLKGATKPVLAMDAEKKTAMQLAWEAGHQVLAIKILTQYYPAEERTEFIRRHQLLHWAAEFHFESLEMLLKTRDSCQDTLNDKSQTFIEVLVQSTHFKTQEKYAHMCAIISSYYKPFYLTALAKAISAIKTLHGDDPYLFTSEQFIALFNQRLLQPLDWKSAIEYPLGEKNALAWAVSCGYYELLQALLAHIPGVKIDETCIQQAITAAKTYPIFPKEITKIALYFQIKKSKDGKKTDGWWERMRDFIALLVHITHHSRLYDPAPFDKWYKSNDYHIARKNLVTLYKAPSGSSADITLQIMSEGFSTLFKRKSAPPNARDSIPDDICKAYETAMTHWTKNPSGDFQPLFSYFLEKFQPGHHCPLVDTKFGNFINLLKRINNPAAPYPREHFAESQYQKLIQRIVNLLNSGDPRAELTRMYHGFIKMLEKLSSTPNEQDDQMKALAQKILDAMNKTPNSAAENTLPLGSEPASTGDAEEEEARAFARATAFTKKEGGRKWEELNKLARSTTPEKEPASKPAPPTTQTPGDDSAPDTSDDSDDDGDLFDKRSTSTHAARP